MRSSVFMFSAPCAAAFLAVTASSAASFSTIATIPGGPQIGAARGGTLYGTIPNAGAGLLFSIGTNGAGYTVLHSFASATDGSTPNARLAIDANGAVFGTAQGGGAHGGGTLWQYDASGGMTTPHAFGAGADGTAPYQGPSLVRGAVFGTTSQGAIGGSGNIFRLKNRAYKVVYDFMSGADGHCPFAGIGAGPHGSLYGATIGLGFGGNPTGSIWKYTVSAGLQTLYVFQNGSDGEYPDQAPTLDAQGNVYGTTHVQNGSDFAGAIWKISASGQFSVLHDLNAATEGSIPNSPLVIGRDGNLYGTAGYGGAKGHGSVFSITPAGAFSLVHSFAGGTDGAQPTGNLVRAGAAIYGGTATGPVFRITP